KTFAVMNTVSDLAPILVIAFAGYQAILGNLTIGTMVAFVGYMERVYSPLRRLINASTVLTQSIASIDRVFEFYNEKYDIVERKNAIDVGTVQGDISIDHVSFSYDKDAPVLKN